MEILKKENKYNKNLGIQILRTLLCFWVVLDHCLAEQKKYAYYNFFKFRLHVPCFAFISFFFSYKTITGRSCIKIRQRFERLLIPYFIFPTIMFILNNICYTYFNFSFFSRYITFYDLIIQFIVGRNFIVVFWFQFYLILTTLLFIIISFVMKENFITTLEIISIISYIILYKNLNYNYFHQFSPFIKFSVGHFVEMMPISISGSVIASLDVFQLIKKYSKKAIFFSCISLYFIFNYKVFYHLKGNFGGFAYNIASFFMFTIFYFFPFNYFDSAVFYNFIYQITKYSNGIYSFHLIFHGTFHSKIGVLKDGSFNRCILIYFLSFFISFIGEKLSDFIYGNIL